MQRLVLGSLVSMIGCVSQEQSRIVDAAARVGRLCEDARADAWQLPITKRSSSGAYSLSLMASSASPPIIGDITRWTLQLADATGAPISDATMGALPFMPDHHHGTTVRAVVSADAANRYEVTPLYFFMAGYWTVTFTLGETPDGGVADEVGFGLCLTDAA